MCRLTPRVPFRAQYYMWFVLVNVFLFSLMLLFLRGENFTTTLGSFLCQTSQ